MNKNNNRNKTCPFLDRPCLGDNCGIYYQQFSKCGIEVLTYNLFKFKDTVIPNPDKM